MTAESAEDRMNRLHAKYIEEVSESDRALAASFDSGSASGEGVFVDPELSRLLRDAKTALDAESPAKVDWDSDEVAMLASKLASKDRAPEVGKLDLGNLRSSSVVELPMRVLTPEEVASTHGFGSLGKQTQPADPDDDLGLFESGTKWSDLCAVYEHVTNEVSAEVPTMMGACVAGVVVRDAVEDARHWQNEAMEAQKRLLALERRAQAAEKEANALFRHVADLLAIIHRDDGSHLLSVGMYQAIEDAKKVWCELQLAADRSA